MAVSLDAQITLASTIVTIISMVVTIVTAIRVKKVKAQIALDLRRINLTHASRTLEKTLNEVRKLLASPAIISRGRGRFTLCDSIQAQFDAVLMQIDIDGPDSDIREIVVLAQKSLQALRSEDNANICNQLTAEIQSMIQDSVSRLNGRYLRLDGKAQ